jgi:hypothetical protein
MRSWFSLLLSSPLEGERDVLFAHPWGGDLTMHCGVRGEAAPPTKIAKGDFDSPSRGELGHLFHHSPFTTHGRL